MKGTAFVAPDFVPDHKKTVRSVRLPDNVYFELEKVSKRLNYESVGAMKYEVLLAFLKGELVDIARIGALAPDNGKIQQLEDEKKQLLTVNREMQEEINLYKSELEQYRQYATDVNTVNAESVNAPLIAVNAVNAPVNTSVNTPFTMRKQMPVLGVNAQSVENVNGFQVSVNTTHVLQKETEGDYLEKIQALEAEVDQYLAEKDDLGGKLENTSEKLEAHEYATDKSFDYLVTEIKKQYGIEFTVSSLNEIHTYFINQFYEQNETGAN